MEWVYNGECPQCKMKISVTKGQSKAKKSETKLYCFVCDKEFNYKECEDIDADT